MRRFWLGLAAAVSLGVAPVSSAWAQQAEHGGQLPPALQAAMASGNAQNVTQLIAALSGNDPQKAAALAELVVASAEKMLASNPQSAVQMAGAAVASVKSLLVQSSAPMQTQDVITTAARIFVSPAAEKAAPDATAQLATSTMQAAASTGNSTLIGNIATQAVSTAEKILVASPAVAVQLAGAAVASVQSVSVQQTSPQDSMQVVATAARIIVQPEAQQIAPLAVANMATAMVQVVSNPVVYQSAPQAAISVMSGAYTAVSSAVVTAASPDSATTMAQNLTQISQSKTLDQANPTNGPQVVAILTKTGSANQPPLAQPASSPVTNFSPVPETKTAAASAS